METHERSWYRFLVAPSFDPAHDRDHPQFLNDAGTDARHLRRVLRNLCGRLAVGQHSQRIKIPCRTCGVSRIAEVFPVAAKYQTICLPKNGTSVSIKRTIGDEICRFQNLTFPLTRSPPNLCPERCAIMTLKR